MAEVTGLTRYRIGTAVLVVLAGLPLWGCAPDAETPWALTATRIAGGFTNPTCLAVPGDGSGRLFITEQTGTVRIIGPSGSVLSEPFLDISDRLAPLVQSYDESGLLGMAFHPEYDTNGRFFLFYTAAPGSDTPEGYHSEVRVSEFTVSGDSPDRADSGSEAVLLEVHNPQPNHNGGQLAFGPDGWLYIGIGDGGNANDVGPGHTVDIGNAQDRTRLLGKILRLDVSEPGRAAVPESNPFAADAEARPEIYAYGLRNPWRFSFDRAGDRELLCGDVGQSLYEEINSITAGGNYGWNIREGLGCFNPDDATDPPGSCPDRGYLGEPLIDPVIVYPHPGSEAAIAGRSVTGGYIYRGAALPQLGGAFVFGDWSASFAQPAGFVLVAVRDAGGAWSVSRASLRDPAGRELRRFLLSFGEDENGEIYLLTSGSLGPAGASDEVFRITGAVKSGS